MLTPYNSILPHGVVSQSSACVRVLECVFACVIYILHVYVHMYMYLSECSPQLAIGTRRFESPVEKSRIQAHRWVSGLQETAVSHTVCV